jgi:hypothetical protein
MTFLAIRPVHPPNASLLLGDPDLARSRNELARLRGISTSSQPSSSSSRRGAS